MSTNFANIGKTTGQIDVKISYKIIDLFSQGLYRSPNKAIEELVANSFDAGASQVHVISSPDLTFPDSSIVVIDNGAGMDEKGLRQHWLIGVSNKRQKGFTAPKGRKQIGKFGIGKLATYVLANKLTHISKVKGKYYATTMDYSSIPENESSGISAQESISLALRELTSKEPT